ncbi:protein FAR1-RELATED SEQUENCE 9-like [Fagus crenata]
MMTICAKGLKKKQGSKGRRRYKSFIEMAKKKKKISIHRPIQTEQYLEEQHVTSTMQLNGDLQQPPFSPITRLHDSYTSVPHSSQDLYIPHCASASDLCNPYPSSLSQAKSIGDHQEQSSFGTCEDSVNCCGRRNLHISFPCSSKNLSDLELDDFSSLLIESTNGRIEAFAKYL